MFKHILLVRVRKGMVALDERLFFFRFYPSVSTSSPRPALAAATIFGCR